MSLALISQSYQLESEDSSESCEEEAIGNVKRLVWRSGSGSRTSLVDEDKPVRQTKKPPNIQKSPHKIGKRRKGRPSINQIRPNKIHQRRKSQSSLVKERNKKKIITPAPNQSPREESSFIKAENKGMHKNSGDETNSIDVKIKGASPMEEAGGDAPRYEIKYRCPYCKVGYQDAAGLIRHLPIHQKDGNKNAVNGTQKVTNLSLEEQNKKITDGRKRKTKELSSAARQNMKPCSTKKTKRIPSASERKLRTLDMKYKCEQCDMAFPRSIQLAGHMNMHDQTRPLKCAYCNYYFLTSGRLQAHEIRVHNREGAKRTNMTTTTPTTDLKPARVKDQNYPLELRPCEVVMSRCDKIVGKTANQNGDDDDTCLKGRRKRHAGTSARKKLKAQLLEIDSGEENSPSQSKKISDRKHNKSSSNSKVQLRKKFSGNSAEKSRCCPICFKVSPTTAQARIHLRIHTKEKPFQCPKCSKAFSQSGNLNVHLRLHAGDRPYECPICSKLFAQKSNLQAHHSFHTGVWKYQCTVCSKGFSQKRFLELHTYTHTGEKPFKCQTCSKGFNRPWTLKYHIQCHTGERPHKCPKCDKRFIRSSYMKYHLMRAHRRD